MSLQSAPVFRHLQQFCLVFVLALLILSTHPLAGQSDSPAPQQSSQPTPTSAGKAASATSAKDKQSSESKESGQQGAMGKTPAGSTEGAASTAPAALPPVPAGRPSIGLALGGGGAPAMSEIGVLQWFEEHHIPVDMIAGTSMGCMVSALYSSGKTIEQLKTVMDDSVFNSVFRFQASYQSRSFRRREDSRDLPNALTIGLKHKVSFRN